MSASSPKSDLRDLTARIGRMEQRQEERHGELVANQITIGKWFVELLAAIREGRENP
jgi:hypothetical protein